MRIFLTIFGRNRMANRDGTSKILKEVVSIYIESTYHVKCYQLLFYLYPEELMQDVTDDKEIELDPQQLLEAHINKLYCDYKRST